MARDESMWGTPITARRSDWAYIVICGAFACTSLLFDAMTLLVGWLSGDPLAWPLAPGGLEMYAAVDPLLVADPVFMQVGVALSGFVWGPLYIYLARGFYRGDNRIRVPGLMYGATLTGIMLMIVAEELVSNVPGWQTPEPGLFIAYNIPYLLFPIAVMARLRSPMPFGVPPVLQSLPDDAARALGLAR